MRAIILLCLLPAAVWGMFSWDPKDHTTPRADHYLKCYDQESCGCCLMERQMNRMEMYFNKSVYHMHELLMKSKTALMNMRASRSAFSVALNNANNMTCFGPFAENMVIIYEHVFLNLGGGYNVNTGIYTAPRSGFYSFAVTVYSKVSDVNQTIAVCASLQKNGMVVSGSTEKNNEDQEDSTTIVVGIGLNAGDEVAVILPAGCFICDNKSHYNTFTGFLLYADDHTHYTTA
ncbi:C1q-related factor-like [Stegastes partitus]|uniref:C1q-related factor-like n=1 Tax=Stegastes partitus TaxID=144197 RepID=A0A9Y4NG99_9TELE|nr:PREDICTED: C1q-related factor-like [Stegastes partitus]